MTKRKEKTYDELTLTDDFLFCKIMTSRKDLCIKLLETILDIKIRDIKYLNSQETIDISYDAKSVRLDVYAEDEKNSVYDIEMQTINSKNLPERSRYYQGIIDLNLIESGEDYKNLKNTFIIFICLNDPFDRDFPIYTFSNVCREDLTLQLEDGTAKIFVNANGITDNVSADMFGLLKYLKGEVVQSSQFARDLDTAVNDARKHEEWRQEFMTLQMRDQEKIEEGRMKMLFELIEKNKISVKDAAEEVDMDENAFLEEMSRTGFTVPTV